MSGYTRRTTRDLEEIRARIADIGRRSAEAVRAAVAALMAGDLDASAEVVLGDLAINRDVRALDALCHRFVSVHLPSAGHLRFVSSVLRLNVGLERVGDQAVTVAREALQLGGPPPILGDELADMAAQASEMLERALMAWTTRDAALARETAGMARHVDSSLAEVLRAVLGGQGGGPGGGPGGGAASLADVYALLVIFSSLERVSDQAKNVCEETVFTVTGETKPPKVYRVLFVDRDNAAISQLAHAIANKTFPASGEYHSAGWAPAPRIDPGMAELLDRWGLVLPNPRPVRAPQRSEELADYHVVVALDPAARGALPPMPFHTVLVTWSVPGHPGDDPLDPRVRARFEDLYRQLSGQVGALMVKLRGEEAG